VFAPKWKAERKTEKLWVVMQKTLQCKHGIGEEEWENFELRYARGKPWLIGRAFSPAGFYCR